MLENKISIRVLQHPKEKKHPLNTIHLARLCLSDIEIRHTPITSKECLKWIQGTALLFPNQNSLPLPKNHTGPLLLLDATWPKAMGMFLSIPALKNITCYHLPNIHKGEYRIRKAPNPQSLSSLETIATALEYLENTPHKYDTLREVLRARIDMQIQYIDPQIFQQNYPQST
jgi:DTW domain-containing protein YfiP